MGARKTQKQTPLPEPPVDFVIVTALPEERDALLAKLPGARKLDKGIKDIHTFYAAKVKTSRKDRSEYSVIVTCLIKMGPITATAQTVSVVTKWQPRYVLLVGIACGVRGAVNHGDVLIATQVADYTIGKQEGGTRKINWDVYPCGVSLLDSANDLSDNWQRGIAWARPGAGEAASEKGVVASGGDVIQDEEIIATYSKAWPKLIGIEMESGGVAAGIHQTADRPEFLLIKCVSDFGEDKHDAEVTPWRSYACHAAAAFAVALIRSGPSPSQAITNRAGARGEAEEKRRRGERQWEYLLSHPFRTLEFFLVLKGEVGRAWFHAMLADASISFDRKASSARLGSLVAAARDSKETNERQERDCEYWRLYEAEAGFWVSRRGTPEDENPDLVAGISCTVAWSAVAPQEVAVLRDLSRVDELGVSLPPRAFDVGVEEFQLIFAGDGFVFSVCLSDDGILEPLHGFAMLNHQLDVPENQRMMLGTGWAGGQLLDIFFQQYLRHWRDEPSPRPFKGRIGRSGVSDKGITFYPREPKSFRGSPEERDYIFTISTPDTESVKKRIAELEGMLRTAPVKDETYLELAARYVAQGRLVEGLNIVQRATAAGVSGPSVQGLWGMILGEMGRHDEAINHLEQAVALEPQSGGRRTALAIGVSAAGRKKDAVAEFRRALSLEPSNIEFQRNLAFALAEADEQIEEAISLFERVLAAAPDNASATTRLGRLLEQVGRKEEAEQCFEGATRVASADAYAFAELGLYRARERDYVAAIAAFEKAVELKKDPQLYELLGGSFVGLDRIEEAEKAFREGHRIDPDHQRCLAQLGAALAMRGAIDEAIPLLKRAVALDPSDEQSQGNLKAVMPSPPS